KMTPQLRSRKYLEDRGWTVATVESLKRFPAKGKPACQHCGAQPQVMIRSDLFGFGDLFAFNDTNEIIVQATDRSNMSARWAKIRALPEARRWVSGGMIAPVERLLAVHGWFKKDNRWQLKEKLVMPEDFERTRCADFDDQDEESLPF